MATLTLYNGISKRLQYGLFGLAFAALAAGGGMFLYYVPGMAWHDTSVGPAYGVAGTLMLFCGGFIGGWGLWTALDWRPKFIIAEDGLGLPKYGGEIVRWADIAEVDYQRITSPRNSNYTVNLLLKVKDPEFRYVSRGEPAADYGVPPGTVIYKVTISGLTMDFKKIMQLVYERLPAAAVRPTLPTYP
jgi:hypothetical protein